jgi:threonine-phosphate decarboxylase
MAASEPYPIHGGQLRQIANRFQIPVSDLLDFSANINPAGPPPGVLHAVRACLEDLSVFTEYPDLQELELKESIARYAKVDIAAITVANGFVPLLEAALGAACCLFRILSRTARRWNARALRSKPVR